MITIEQCRAARGLLGWTQQDLATAARMSKTAINNFERGNSDVEEAGVEFTDNFGVRKRMEVVQILKGDDANMQLLDDIYDTLKNTGGEVLINSVDEKKVWDAYPERISAHLARLKDAGITERMLACEGDNFFLQPAECYRWIPRELFAISTITFVYGNKVAISDTGGIPSGNKVAIKLWNEHMIIIIDSRQAAEAEKQRFEYIWERSRQPDIPDSDRDSKKQKTG